MNYNRKKVKIVAKPSIQSFNSNSGGSTARARDLAYIPDMEAEWREGSEAELVSPNTNDTGSPRLHLINTNSDNVKPEVEVLQVIEADKTFFTRELVDKYVNDLRHMWLCVHFTNENKEIIFQNIRRLAFEATRRDFLVVNIQVFAERDEVSTIDDIKLTAEFGRMPAYYNTLRKGVTFEQAIAGLSRKLEKNKQNWQELKQKRVS